MTLNIMLTSSSGLYLTGDFRLTEYPSGKWQDDIRAQKLIPVFKHGWSALISFAGIAKTPQGIDIGDWISGQTQKISMDAAFDELPAELLKVNNWFIKMRGQWPLAISVVAFIRRRPVMIVISNYLDINGRTFDPLLPQLELSKHKPNRPEVRIMGDRKTVHSDEIDYLRKLLTMTKSPREIEIALADINVSASRRSTTISQACVTGSLLPSGLAEVTPHGINDRIEYMPAFVKRGLLAQGILGFNYKTDQDGKPLPPKWVGMTARVPDKRRKSGATIFLYAISNVESPIASKQPENSYAFWKIAGENEPKRYTFEIQESGKQPKDG